MKKNLIDLIPKEHRNKEMIDLLTKWENKYGYDYVKENIEYANRTNSVFDGNIPSSN